MQHCHTQIPYFWAFLVIKTLTKRELIECDEGELCWVDKTVVPELPTWEGDRVFLDMLLSGEERFFSLKLRYEGDKLVEKKTHLY